MSDFGYTTHDTPVIRDGDCWYTPDGDPVMESRVSPAQVVAPGQVAVDRADIEAVVRGEFSPERHDRFRAALVGAEPTPTGETEHPEEPLADWEKELGDPCPTCSGQIRETRGMVCQTCGTDYAAEPAPDSGQGETVCGACGGPKSTREHYCYDCVVAATTKATNRESYGIIDTGPEPAFGLLQMKPDPTPAASGGGTEAGGDEGEDGEEFCPKCFAGMESDEHHTKCVVPAEKDADDEVTLPDTPHTKIRVQRDGDVDQTWETDAEPSRWYQSGSVLRVVASDLASVTSFTVLAEPPRPPRNWEQRTTPFRYDEPPKVDPAETLDLSDYKPIGYVGDDGSGRLHGEYFPADDAEETS